MGTSRTTPPHNVIPFTGLGGEVWRRYFFEQHQFLKDVAKEAATNVFTEQQKLRLNGEIADGGILLQNAYFGGIDLMLSTSNVGAHPIGGQAGAYIQHLVDNGIATTNNVNSGIRVQIESKQQRSAGTLVNDLVGGYFGIRNSGTDVGGFGVHVDAYSNGAGASTTMYGMSVELYRETNNGFTVGFHARSIDAAGYFDNDYAFLASPSVAGTKKFDAIFSGGSAQTGTMQANRGLDLAFSTFTQAAIRIPTAANGGWFFWDGIAGNVFQTYDNVGEWQHWVSAVKLFGFENTGRLYNVNNANTVVNTAFVASANKWVVNIGGTLYKIQLGVYP